MRIKWKINLDTREILREASSALDAGLIDAGKEVVAVASVLAPKDTGSLSRSGKVEKTATGVEVSFGSENSQGEYEYDDARAIFMEFGTMRNRAQPFLMPAVELVDITFFINQKLRGIG